MLTENCSVTYIMFVRRVLFSLYFGFEVLAPWKCLSFQLAEFVKGETLLSLFRKKGIKLSFLFFLFSMHSALSPHQADLHKPLLSVCLLAFNTEGNSWENIFS